MASIISAGTTSGTSLNLSGDTSGVLQLATNGSTTAVTINTSQNVGIGTTSPATKFHVSGQTRIADSSNSANYMTFGVGSNAPYGNASLSTTTAGLAIVAEGNGVMNFFNNGSERMRIPAAGGLQVVGSISVGNVTPTTSGAGITFPATQSASSDANTLDDYEEGTWTPSYGGSSSDPTVSYLQRNGRYVKIGQFVQVTAELQTSSVSGGSGALQIKGLPFAVLDSRYVGSGVTGYSNTFGTNAPRAGYCNTGGTNFLTLTYYNSASAQTESQISDLGTGSGANYLIFTATYRAST